MSNIFLHIGINKTGTSALQSFFSRHRELLKAQGLLYPRTACNDMAHYALSHELGFGLGSPQSTTNASAKCESLRRELDEEIADAGNPAVLISSEHFVRPANISRVREFFAHDHVRIVVYLRRHDTWFPALYSQALKTSLKNQGSLGWDPAGIEAFIEFQCKRLQLQGYYRRLLDRWSAVFGHENIIVRPYESGQNAPDIVVDLLRSIVTEMGIDSDEIAPLLSVRSTRRNLSLAPRTLQLLEVFQRAQLDSDVRRCLMHHALSLPIIEPPQSMLSPASRLKLIEENAADYEYIAREYLGRKDGRLFYDPLPDLGEPWRPLNPLTQKEIVEETVAAILGAGKETKRRFSLQMWLKKIRKISI